MMRQSPGTGRRGQQKQRAVPAIRRYSVSDLRLLLLSLLLWRACPESDVAGTAGATATLSAATTDAERRGSYVHPLATSRPLETMSRLCFTFVPAGRGKDLVRPVRDTLWPINHHLS